MNGIEIFTLVGAFLSIINLFFIYVISKGLITLAERIQDLYRIYDKLTPNE